MYPSKIIIRNHFLPVVMACKLLLVCITPSPVTAASSAAVVADEFLVVDCLLPGQIRQLGRSSTYLSARRPAKTTARECEIRGGEYVSYDRASYSTALKIWLPLAKEGDTNACVNVGEIYEKGLGLKPDYEAALYWYTIAAEGGNFRGQINLAHLHEKGLGTRANPNEALKWYRRASGLNESISLDPGTLSPTVSSRSSEKQEREEKLLTLQVKQLADKAADLRSKLKTTLVTLNKTNTQLKKQNTSRATAIEQQHTLQEKLNQIQKKLMVANQSLEEKTRQASADKGTLVDLKFKLSSYEHDASKKRKELANLLSQASTSKSEKLNQRAKIVDLELIIKALENESHQYREKLKDYENLEQAKQERVLAGPGLTIIDPIIPTTRGMPVVTMNAGVTNRQIVGQVNAPAGLLTLSVNNNQVTPNSSGIFVAHTPINKTKTPISVVAIDQQGKKTVTQFVLRTPDEGTQSLSISPEKNIGTSIAQKVDFGKYFALVIGNNEHKALPDLETAINDANTVAEVLKSNYNFTVTKLINATRYEILSALNNLREKLTSHDNLLIYYAGHGELDKINMRGHWLPSDAEPDNTANWISNVSVTDILNVINAKEILLVVDSCYSGALTRSALSNIDTAMTEEERLNWFKTISKKRSRTVLTSGGLEPVLDSGGGEHSIFGKAFLDVITNNKNVLEGQRLYHEVAARVAYAASKIRFEQIPEYAPIKYSGHEGGDFFLVPNH